MRTDPAKPGTTKLGAASSRLRKRFMVGSISLQKVPDKLGRMNGDFASQVLDLLAAGCSGRDQNVAGLHLPHRRKQFAVGDGHRDVVMIAAIAERSGHAA